MGVKMVKRKITRSKTVAIWLAVLFGIFSWIYTWKLDAWKFWLNLGVTLVLSLAGFGFYGMIALIWVIVDQIRKPKEVYDNYGDY